MIPVGSRVRVIIPKSNYTNYVGTITKALKDCTYVEVMLVNVETPKIFHYSELRIY